MYIAITVFIIIVCILLSVVVLIQNPKGGGLSSSFGNVGQQILGARRSTDIVEKATWTLAILLLAFSIGSAGLIDKRAKSTTGDAKVEKSAVEKQLNNTVNPFPGTGNTTPQPAADNPTTPPPATAP